MLAKQIEVPIALSTLRRLHSRYLSTMPEHPASDDVSKQVSARFARGKFAKWASRQLNRTLSEFWVVEWFREHNSGKEHGHTMDTLCVYLDDTLVQIEKQIYPVQAGTAVLIPANVMHGIPHDGRRRRNFIIR